MKAKIRLNRHHRSSSFTSILGLVLTVGFLVIVLSLTLALTVDASPADSLTTRSWAETGEADSVTWEEMAACISPPCLEPGWFSSDYDQTWGVAWGDMDGDGDLDLAVGNDGSNKVYLNEGGTLQRTAAWQSVDSDDTRGVAWGDVDGDGDLDLVAGNLGDQNKVYLNEGGSLQTTAAWQSDDSDWTRSVAWGDVNGDGNLDLAAGNNYSPNKVYTNEGGILQTTAAWQSVDSDVTYSVAWGDVDGDGDLDLVAGNDSSNKMYMNEGGILQTTAAWQSDDSDDTWSVAWGDVDGDGDLDLAAGNHYDPNKFYLNQRPVHSVYPGQTAWLALRLNSDPVQTFNQSVTALAPADFFAVPGIRQSGTIPITYTLFHPAGSRVQSVQGFYSLDGGGRWYTATATNTLTTDLTTAPAYVTTSHEFDWIDITSSGISVTLTDTQVAGPFSLGFGLPFFDQTVGQFWISSNGWLAFSAPDGPASLNECLPSGTAPANLVAPFWDDLDPGAGGQIYYQQVDTDTLVVEFYQVPHHQGGGPYTFEVILQHDGTITFQYLDVSPSLDSATIGLQNREGDEALQLACNSPFAQNNMAVSARRVGQSHVYTWDVFASDFFGQSDDVVFRLEAYPVSCHDEVSGTYRYTNAVPGPYQRPYVSAHTYPFRVRGFQIRVLSDTLPAAGALVYRRPGGETDPYEPYRGNAGRLFYTNLSGYLQGRGEITIGDHLVALAPVTYTESYTLCYTNATPTPIGLDAYTVTAPGVQTLTVSADHPLALFNLDVSLEWDARKDSAFLEQLEYDLARTSELLYDWTNGQAALGRVRVFHDREKWLDAHVRVYASNRLRPSAVKGGIASTIITDPLTTTITYAPGQVRTGATWNRFGDPGSGLGEDWPRTLAHELGHFALFLDDNYLGLDEGDLLISVDTCPGVMSDPYREDYPYDEFHPEAGWLPACEQTLSHRSTGRSDWSTITTFYPPFGVTANAGPSLLPLAVTGIEFVAPITPPVTLEVPLFYLFQDGGHVQPGPRAQVFLFQEDRLVPLGRPTLDRVEARGARPGDRLCVYEPDAERLGCEVISPPDQQLDLVARPGWQPEVLVSPVTSRTLALTVTNVPAGLPLQARLFSVNYPAPPEIVLVETAGEYTGTFELDQPVFEGYVHLWVDEAEPRRETVTGYALGGNPGHMWSRNAPRGSPGHKWSRFAPVIFSDGQVILYGEHLDFAEGEFFALQAATHLPSAPSWTTVVGQGCWLIASPNAPDLRGTSISFAYLGSEVPPGEEGWLRIYFWDGETWQPLPTRLSTDYNVASAPTQGMGLYALMTSVEVPLSTPGWNLFSYPVLGARPVTEALLSISGYYTTVYGYEAEDVVDPWRVYDVTVPEWVNDLEELEYGHGYWINVSEAITLYLKGGLDSIQGGDGSIPTPPATYYGPVLAGSGFTPTVGMPVTAWMEDHLCGQGVVTDVVGYGLAYVVDVLADDGDSAAGCGIRGRAVVFRIGSQPMVPDTIWNNGRLRELPLSPIKHIYLPLVVKNR